MTAPPHRHRVGELRPSQILFTYGIGAIADLPSLSVMVMGLEGWNKSQTLELSEERLLIAVRHELGSQVKDMRSPPMPPDTDAPFDPLDEAARIGIPVAPFPTWMVCPKCRLLAPLQSGLFELKTNAYRLNDARYVHKGCSGSRKPPTVIPSRFLVACEHGHLDDFPWHYFVHRGASDCNGPLRFEEYGVTGAATDIMVRCNGCDMPARRLSEAFGASGKENMPRCRGRHPHIRSFDDDCPKQMRGMLLGASNGWFGINRSALSIPIASN
ncbi:MAG: DrmB family protein, partial [Elainellaceae cyanobacterium]